MYKVRHFQHVRYLRLFYESIAKPNITYGQINYGATAKRFQIQLKKLNDDY